jgi:hypothetical protein
VRAADHESPAAAGKSRRRGDRGRSAQHLRNGLQIERVPGLGGLTKLQARGVEQALIEQHGLAKYGGTLINKINSIASTNSIYTGAVRWGRDRLVQVGYR